MAQVTKNLPDTDGSATLASTELNSLANNANVLGVEYNNNLDAAGDSFLYGLFEMYVASLGGAAAASSAISVWLLSAYDGTNYEDGGASVTPSRMPDMIFPLRAVATAQRIVLKDIPLPIGKFKALVRNDATGQTMASSLNTLKMLAYTPEFV